MTTDETTTEQSGTEEEGQEPETETSETQEPETDQAAEETATEDEQTEDGEDETSLSDEDARKAVSKLRKENASWRKKFRDLEAKMAEAVTPEQISALKAEMEEQSRSLLVENVALKYDLPAELAARLSGTTREELETDAQSLAKFVVKIGTSADNLSGGLDPSSDEGEFDPAKVAAELRRNRRNY